MKASRFIGLCLLALLGALQAAGATEYTADHRAGTVRFSAIQQGAAFDGGFERFTARISFDPEQLDAAVIEASIDLRSINTQNAERDGYLHTEDWLDTRRWPVAEFAATDITPADGGGYVARGKLTIRDVSLPTDFRFTLAPEAAPGGEGALRLHGEATLSRLAFGIGRGEWRDTRWVGDTVSVTVDLRLSPVPPAPEH